MAHRRAVEPFVQPVRPVRRVRVSTLLVLPFADALVYAAFAVSGFVVGALVALAVGPS